MELLFTIVLSLMLTFVQSYTVDLERRQTTSKFCSSDGGVCYVDIATRPGNPTYRVAIADSSAAPFDTLLQIISPASLGWAGFAWGGGMTLNPLTVAWPNGDKAVVSSRWATGSVLPGAYSGASYTTLASAKNSTHWMIEVLCSGCSRWSGRSLRPTDVNTFAWAVGKAPVSQPSNNGSNFARHTNNGMFSVDLSTAKVSRAAFQQYVSSASSKPAASRF